MRYPDGNAAAAAGDDLITAGDAASGLPGLVTAGVAGMVIEGVPMETAGDVAFGLPGLVTTGVVGLVTTGVPTEAGVADLEGH